MKSIVIVLFLFSFGTVYSQADKKKGQISYIINFDEMTPAKDGYWFDGYLFETNPMETAKLKGKKIKISGHYKTVNDGLLKVIDKNGNIMHKQGRAGNYKVVANPKIRIITDKK